MRGRRERMKKGGKKEWRKGEKRYGEGERKKREGGQERCSE